MAQSQLKQKVHIIIDWNSDLLYFTSVSRGNLIDGLPPARRWVPHGEEGPLPMVSRESRKWKIETEYELTLPKVLLEFRMYCKAASWSFIGGPTIIFVRKFMNCLWIKQNVREIWKDMLRYWNRLRNNVFLVILQASGGNLVDVSRPAWNIEAAGGLLWVLGPAPIANLDHRKFKTERKCEFLLPPNLIMFELLIVSLGCSWRKYRGKSCVKWYLLPRCKFA